MERNRNYILKIEEEKESLPILFEELTFISEEERLPESDILSIMPDDEESAFSQLNSEVDKVMRHANNLISFTSVWYGRVLSVMQDTVLARISNQLDDEEEFFVEIQKSRLTESQIREMVPGTRFDWSFGYQNMDVEQHFWKLEIQQQAKPSPEAIRQMAARMIAGFESYYEDKD